MKQPLLEDKKNKEYSKKFYFTAEMSPITRYNIVIDIYNTPNNKIEDKALNNISVSQFYEFQYTALSKLRGKILFALLCLLPGINLLPLCFAIYLAVYYWRSLKRAAQNTQIISDPFKKMSFDPEICYSMGCDYYQFNIQLKQLQGFSLNYKQNVSQRLNLKRQRGKTSLSVYNATFWASYAYIDKWKLFHYLPLAFSALACLTINTLLIILLTL